MRNQLPKKPRQYECGIINLDDKDGYGTHWSAYCKSQISTYYFDSFGNLQPPMELIKYLGSGSQVFYNHRKYQSYRTTNCGQLCLQYLYNFYYGK